MQWIHNEPVRGVNGPDELRLGIASWDDGSKTSLSIKYTWFDKNGRAARGGEFPVEALDQMVEFARSHKYPTRKK